MLHRREGALYRPGLREQAAGFDGIRSPLRVLPKNALLRAAVLRSCGQASVS